MKLKKICWHYPDIYTVYTTLPNIPKCVWQVPINRVHKTRLLQPLVPIMSYLRCVPPSTLYEFFVWFSTCCVITLFFVCCFFFTLGFWCLAEWICCCDISRDRLAWFHGNPFPSTKTPILHSFYSRFFLLFISLFLFNCEIPPLSFVLSLLLKRIK